MRDSVFKRVEYCFCPIDARRSACFHLHGSRIVLIGVAILIACSLIFPVSASASMVQSDAQWATPLIAQDDSDPSPDAGAGEGGTIASGEYGTCLWTIDAQGALTVSPLEGDTGILTWWYQYPPWHDYCEQITAVRFEGTIQAQTCESLFNNCKNLTEVDLTGLDTSRATSMQQMFYHCESLESVDVSKLDTSRMESLYWTFMFCGSLKSLDLSSWKTSNVTTMQGLVEGCSALTSLNLTGFNTSSVDDLSHMFQFCSMLETLDVSSFDTSKASNMSCMFDGCTKLVALDTSRFNATKAKDLYNMFASCSALTLLNLSNFDTPQAENAINMFSNCEELEKIIASKNLSFGETVKTGGMFSNCMALRGATGTSFAAERVADGSYARIDTDETPGYFWPAEEAVDPGGNNGGTGDNEGDGEGGGNGEGSGNGGGNSNGTGNDESNPNELDENGSDESTPSNQSNQSNQNSVNQGNTSAGTARSSNSNNATSNSSANNGGSASVPSSSATPNSSKNGGKASSNSDSPKTGTTTTSQNGSNNASAEPSAASSIDTEKQTITTSSKPVSKSKRTSIAKATVKLSKTSYTYDGKAHKPRVTSVKLGSKKLKEGRDYVVARKPISPRALGTYTMTVKGIGNYKGTATASFTIKRISIAKATVKLPKSSLVYDGTAQRPRVIVKMRGKTLKSGSDYRVIYAKNRKMPGTCKVTIRGLGNYKGLTYTRFTIKPAPIAKAAVTLSATSFGYDGKTHKPRVAAVTLDGKTLKAGRDYSVSYAKGRTKPGTYKVTIKGMGGYKGTASTSFTIALTAPAISSLKAHKNSNGTSGFIVSWKKAPTRGIGYELRWSSSKTFKKADTIAFDATSTYAKAASAALRVRQGGWLGKPVYVQVRSFCTVGDTTSYSSWSSAKTVKLEK